MGSNVYIQLSLIKGENMTNIEEFDEKQACLALTKVFDEAKQSYGEIIAQGVLDGVYSIEFLHGVLEGMSYAKGSVFEALGMAAKKEDSIVDNGDKGSDGEWFA